MKALVFSFLFQIFRIIDSLKDSWNMRSALQYGGVAMTLPAMFVSIANGAEINEAEIQREYMELLQAINKARLEAYRSNIFSLRRNVDWYLQSPIEGLEPLLEEIEKVLNELEKHLQSNGGDKEAVFEYMHEKIEAIMEKIRALPLDLKFKEGINAVEVEKGIRYDIEFNFYDSMESVDALRKFLLVEGKDLSLLVHVLIKHGMKIPENSFHFKMTIWFCEQFSDLPGDIFEKYIIIKKN